MFETRVPFEAVVAEELASAVAGLGAAVTRLGALDPAAAGARALLSAAGELEAAGSRLRALQARVLAALDVADLVPEDQSPVRDATGAVVDRAVLDLSRVGVHEVSTVLDCPVEQARDRVAEARHAATDLPGLLTATADGNCPWWQLRRVTEVCAGVGLAPAAAAGLADRVLADRAAGRARSGFTRRLARHLIALDPSAAAARADAELARRHLSRRVVRRGPDAAGGATSWLGACLPAEDAATVWAALDRLADTDLSRPSPHSGLCPDHLPAVADADGRPVLADPRCIDQRRADALTGLAHLTLETLDNLDTRGVRSDPDSAGTRDSAAAAVRARLATALAPAPGSDPGDPSRPTRRRRRPGARQTGELLVTLSAETLLGIDDAPAELAGHGPITAGHARRLAATGSLAVRRLLTDPSTGALLETGPARRVPGAALAAHVRARDGGHCTRPQCGHRIRDLDHARPWTDPDGGPPGATTSANLHGVCRGCHTAKHRGGWTVDLAPDGQVAWHTPHGWTATRPPHDLRPDDRTRGGPSPGP